MYGPAFRFKVVCCAAFDDEGSLECVACFYALTSIKSRKSVAPVQRVCLFDVFFIRFAQPLFAGLCACKIMNLWSSLNVVSSTNQPKDASRGYTHHARSFGNARVANTQGCMTGFEVPKLDFANVRRSLRAKK